MRFGLDISQHQLTWPEIRDRALLAEDWGFDGVWVFDHFKALYGDPDGPCFEGWSLLAALAVATERVRLGALVTGVTYRHPAILAAQATTIDHVSNGRLEFAIGAAWFEQEHIELGVDFPTAGERIERLEEAIEIARALWTEDDANFEGKHLRLQGARYRPKPLQRPHPPIWVGASGEERTIPLAGRLADVWHGFGSPAALKRRSAILDASAEEAGRDPASILRATSLSISEPLDEIRETAQELAGLGFGCLVVSWPGEGASKVQAFVDTVMPDLAER